MSKMSQLHAELSEQANELGFETIQDAVNSGYDVDYEKGKLVKRGLGYSETVEYLTKEQEKAHKAWLEERESIGRRLNKLYDKLVYLDMGEEDLATINDTIEFIRKGEM